MKEVDSPCRIVAVSIQHFELTLLVFQCQAASSAVAMVAAPNIEDLVCGVSYEMT